jgi:hypothetical protein
MATAPSSPILQTIRGMVEDQGVKELYDHEVLCRFVTEHDEAAFDTVLRRHGPYDYSSSEVPFHALHDANSGADIHNEGA